MWAPDDDDHNFLVALEKSCARAEKKHKNKPPVVMVLQERVHLDKLIAFKKELLVPEERTKWQAYRTEMLQKRGQRQVTYRQSPKTHPFGRLYADGALSLQGFSHIIREHVSKGLYHDVDMCNCHPNLLRSFYCKKHELECPRLQHYIEHREEELQVVARRFGGDRSKAKTVFLSLIYGGAIPPECKDLPFLSAFALELSIIAERLFALYPEVPHSKKKDARPAFSRMSILLQDLENKILLQLVEWFKQKNFVPAVLMFDGLLIYQSPDFNADVLRACEVELNLIEQYGIRLEEKK